MLVVLLSSMIVLAILKIYQRNFAGGGPAWTDRTNWRNVDATGFSDSFEAGDVSVWSSVQPVE